MGKEAKIEKYIKQEEVPVFLRSLADAIENGAEGENGYLSVIKGFQRLKMSIKNEFGQTCIKIKAKPPKLYGQTNEEIDDNSAGTDSDDQKISYSKLKKQMKSAFRVIFKTIHDGTLPPEEAVKQFIENSHLMVTYPGYGDEYYEEFSAAVDHFEKTYAEGNLEKIHEACDALNNIKAHCHAKYD